MTRGAKVRRGVVALSVVVAGAAGCAAGAGVTTPTAAGPTRATEIIDFPVGSWRRLPPSPPARLEIPAIGVSTTLVRLGLLADGTMEVPRDDGVAGWFTGGPMPGQLGPAVIAGHVDSRTGPAVFYRATTTPALRLITCAGDFDRSRRSYRDNLVVSAIRVRDGAAGGGGGAAGR
jgi:hypothetical protein